MAAGKAGVLQIKLFRRERKARVQLMTDRSMTLPYHVTITIGESPRILFSETANPICTARSCRSAAKSLF